MKLDKEKMIKTIIVHGWYGQFKKFCTSTPSIRSRKRKAYLFLISIGRRDLIDLMCKVNSPIQNVSNVYSIAQAQWLDR